MSIRPNVTQNCNTHPCESPPEFADGDTFFYVNSSAMCAVGSCSGKSAVAWNGTLKFCGNTSQCTISKVLGNDGYYYKRGPWAGISGACQNGSATGNGCHTGSPAMYKVSRQLA